MKSKEIKSSSKTVDTAKLEVLVMIWKNIYYGELRKNPIKKADLIFKYGKHKDIVEKVWECVYDLKLEWPYEMYDHVYDLQK